MFSLSKVLSEMKPLPYLTVQNSVRRQHYVTNYSEIFFLHNREILLSKTD